ncbi:MAG: helix-turn-helix transcriptional regulator [Gemmatimonadota bacterium]
MTHAQRDDAPTHRDLASRAGRGAGPLLRTWREKRRLSQLALALDAGVSSRHLSFVETGRAAPSAEMIVRLAEALRIPLRERNHLLLAAGYAPAYDEQPLSSPPLLIVTDALQRLLDAHDPYPGVALDRQWNVVLTNAASRRMLSLLPDSLRTPSVNMFRASLHPDGFAAFTTNFAAWARHIVGQLELLADTTLDTSIQSLLDEVREYPNVRRLLGMPLTSRDLHGGILLSCQLTLGDTRLSLFTTLATLGSPRDVTLSELKVELFYPADAETGDALRRMGG